MTHEIDMTTGKAAMAYVGQKPWHGLGEELEPNAPLEVWARSAGMDVELGETRVITPDQIEVPDMKIIYRKDNDLGLSVVSNRYKLVQPIEVLDFFKRYVGDNAQLETAGMLKEGRVYWALAKLDGEINIAGDITNPYLMLSSSCDGSMATQARLTSVRVVCNNTLTVATNKDTPQVVKVRHNSVFDAGIVGAQIEEHYASLKAHRTMLETLARVKLTDKKAAHFIRGIIDNVKPDVLAQEEKETEAKVTRTGKRIFELYKGEAMGAEAESAKNTAYGLLQATTQYYDHEYGRSQDSRLQEAWFGWGATQKRKMMNGLLEAA